MAKPDGHGQPSIPGELTLEELDEISAGHGVVPPPPGFNIEGQTEAPPPKPVSPVGTKII